jgi:hypothetical protein
LNIFVVIASAIVVVVLYLLRLLVLPDLYSDTLAGDLGFIAVLFGIALFAFTSMHVRAPDQKDATAVVRLTGPVVPLIYTGLTILAWLCSPILFDNLAIAIHVVLAGACALGMIAHRSAESATSQADREDRLLSRGRDDILTAAKTIQRSLCTETDPAVRTSFEAMMEEINYSDRNGSKRTVELEADISSAIEALSLNNEDAQGTRDAIMAIKKLLQQRRDELKLEKS